MGTPKLRASTQTPAASAAVSASPAMPTQKLSSITTRRRLPIETPTARRLANSLVLASTAPLERLPGDHDADEGADHHGKADHDRDAAVLEHRFLSGRRQLLARPGLVLPAAHGVEPRDEPVRLGRVADLDDQGTNTRAAGPEAKEPRRLARHEHHRIEHRGIAGGRAAHPHRPAVSLGLLARRYPQPAETRAIDSHRERLLERLNEVSAEIRRQRDRAGYRVDDDDLHAAGLVRLACPRKVRPEAESKVQRLHLQHFRVPVDQRN